MIREVSRRLRDNDEMVISDLQIKAAELSQAYQQLAEQELAYRQFLNMIAHELRTPLTAAGGILQIARQGLVDKKRPAEKAILTAALGTVSENLQRITTLVNDILFLQEMDLIFSESNPSMSANWLCPPLSSTASGRSKTASGGTQIFLLMCRRFPATPGA